MGPTFPSSTTPPVKTDTPVETKSVESPSPETKTEAAKSQKPPEDPKAAAKNAHAAKQHGAAAKSDRSMQAQMVQKNLANQLPAKNQPPVMDQKYYEKLADMPQKDLENYYRGNPDLRKPLRENYNKINSDQLDPATRTKLEGLGGKLQELQDTKWNDKAVKHFAGRSSNDIAKEFVDRAEVNFAGNRPDRIKDMALDLQYLASSKDPKAAETYEKTFEAFKGAVQHRQVNGSPTIPKSEIIDQMEKLSGPGAAKVKADMIKYMVDSKPGAKPKEVSISGVGSYSIPGEDKNPQYPGVYVSRLMKSDPSGIVNELEYMRDKDKVANGHLLDRSLKSVARAYAKQPDKAADTLGTMIGSATADYMDAIREVPPNQARITNYGHRVGHLQRSAENMVGYIGDEAKRKIDNGAFIVNTFRKGVETMLGRGGLSKSDVEKVGKLSGKAEGLVEGMRKKEYDQVNQWQAGMRQVYDDMMDGAFFAYEPSTGAGSREAQDFRAQRSVFEGHIQDGYDNHVKEEKEYAKRGRLP